MMVVLAWASWNGATFYIDVFGKRMEKELNALKKEVQNMSKSPSIEGMSNVGSPVGSPAGPTGADGAGAASTSALDLGPPASQGQGRSLDQVTVGDSAGKTMSAAMGEEDAKKK